ncbi:hypothetical protein AB0P17_26790 [Streptomyces sp. NPDC088124]|uniref:hypothetical protein n=1 Tax=Streptomyces sp. NPDC088124 TaxID=3154654 RepID=UPI0034440DCC
MLSAIRRAARLDPARAGHTGPAGPRTAGEIYIGGAGVADGYLNRPEPTARLTGIWQRLLETPAGPEDNFFELATRCFSRFSSASSFTPTAD